MNKDKWVMHRRPQPGQTLPKVNFTITFDPNTGAANVQVTPPETHPLSQAHLLLQVVIANIQQAIMTEQMIIRPPAGGPVGVSEDGTKKDGDNDQRGSGDPSGGCSPGDPDS